MDELDKFQEGAGGLQPTPITEQPVEPPAAVEPAPQPQQQEQAPQMPAEEDTRNFIQQASDFAAEALGLRSQEESQKLRTEGSAQIQENVDAIQNDGGLGEFTDNTVGEATRAVAGGLAGAVEGVGETAELLGDTVKQGLGLNNGDETQNPFSDEYESAEWDLGITENKTAVGGFAREAITLLTAMRFVPGGKLGQGSRVGRVGTEAARGAIADFFVGGEDGNLSTSLEEGFQLFGNDVQLNNAFIQAISVDEDDNPYEARLKNMVEGGIFGIAVDGVGELIGAFRAGRKIKDAGGTPEEAADAVVKYVQGELPLEPGRAQRVQDQTNYGSTPQNQPMYEPSDAAARTSDNTPQSAALSQERAAAFDNVSTPTGARAVLTDAAYDLILSPRAVQGATEDAVKSTRNIIAKTASSIDVDQLAKDLGQSHDVTVAKALNLVRDFVGQADELSVEDSMKLLDGMTFTDDLGEAIPTRQGVVALKTLIKDTAFQLSEVSMNLMDGAASAADFVRQTEMLVPRLKALTRMHKVGSVHYGSGLNAFKIGAIGNASGPGKLMKDIADMDKELDELLDLARKGDPKALEDFKNIANGLVASNGDPKKVLSFWQLFRKVGGREALTTMYNSFLSGPVTHVRNIMGNTMAVSLRPISMALGHGMSGNFGKAGAALGSFHSFHDSVWEALKVSGQALKTGMPINEGQKFASLTKQTAADLDTLRKSANTTSEKGAAFFLTKVHDLVNNPWATLPSRLLTASDDAFKTLTARMEMKRQVFEESLDPKSAGFGFDEKKYAALIEKKTGVNGEIVDQKILDIAKENTFQQELHGTMKRIADLADSDPIFKYFMPFVRTPHNLMVYAGTHTPIINKFMDEYKAVMKGTDENAKAIMRGREAIGWMTTISAVGLALNGTITGNGPVDPQKRKLWLKTNQPQSIKIAGKWVSYSSVEPLNVIFAAATDMVKIAQAGDNAAYDRNVGQLAYTIAQATYNRSYFQGLQSAVSFMNPEELAKGKVLPREFAKLVNTFIPLSGARRQLARAMAPGMYEYRNELDRALGSALPGYNNAMGLQKVDIFTKEKMETDQTNPWNWILPFKITDVNNDMVLKTLSEKGIDFNTVMKSANGIELTAEDKVAIDELTADQDIHKKLEKLFKADWWKEDYAEWEQRKARGDSSDIRDARWYERTVAIIQQARTAAVKQYRMTNEDFSARYKAAKANDYNAGRGNYEALVELNQK